MSELVSVDARSFRKFSSALKKAQPALAVTLRSRLKAAGNLVAEEARTRASYSTRIPGSVKVSVAGGKVSVTAGGKSAPDAAPLENKGNAGNFRHPVFGNREVWVEQAARPFLHPALDAKKEEARGEVAEAVVATLEEIAAASEL